ncbi:MAG TPA: UbiA family prenyltransferase, partial [Burkholderiales bacterium]|nr:UbiA family prenyltransferase [Burkholderiales bacterium]
MLRDYIQLVRLDKPIGILLLLWPTLWGLLIAGNGNPPIKIVLVFIIGVILTRSAGCAINDFADRNFDSKVKRTLNRPLARRAINKNSAIFICMILSFIAFIITIYFLHIDTILMSIPALIIYLSYPFMKRFFLFPQAYMAIAFSFGILMGFIELTGKIPLEAYLLFLANCFWAFGYDTIYAMVDKEDDLK